MVPSSLAASWPAATLVMCRRPTRQVRRASPTSSVTGHACFSLGQNPRDVTSESRGPQVANPVALLVLRRRFPLRPACPRRPTRQPPGPQRPWTAARAWAAGRTRGSGPSARRWPRCRTPRRPWPLPYGIVLLVGAGIGCGGPGEAGRRRVRNATTTLPQPGQSVKYVFDYRARIE